MELLTQVSNTQLLFPVAAVAVVLVCAALVFVFGFHSAEQPQFDKLPLVVDDRKSSSKKRKTKDKKSSPNRSATEDVKSKSESSKKSPSKEKKEEKVKEEKPKPKERQEPKPLKKEAKDAGDKKAKKAKSTDADKPADFDEGVWEEVPKKSEKKKVEGKKKAPEEKEKKKESPAKKNKKVVKEADVEAAQSNEESSEEPAKVSVGPEVDEEWARTLQAQVEEFQRVLKEAERRDQAALGGGEDEAEPDDEEVPDVKDLRSNKKKENKEKQIKKKETAAVARNVPKAEPVDNSDVSDKQEDKQNVPVFDELGDTWTDAKASKKGKKKARKDQ